MQSVTYVQIVQKKTAIAISEDGTFLSGVIIENETGLTQKAANHWD
ncbi:MAG: hypothetical protein ACTS2F_25655 [Thainema sp.]